MIRTALRFILIVYKVGDNIRLAYVDQKAVADDYRSLQLGKCSIPFSKISNFVLTIQQVKLNIKLPSLMIIAAAHHWINRRWLLLAGIGVVRIVAGNDEIVHLFLEDLLASPILDIASSGTCAVLAADIVLLVLDTILNAKVRVAVEFLTTWTIFIACSIEYLALLWHNTHWINHHCEVFFEVCRAQYFQLQIWNIALFY